MKEGSISKWDKFKLNLKQQRLPAHKPEFYSPNTFIPGVFVTGVICVIIGGIFVTVSENVQELQLDYTDCEQYPSISENQTCVDVLRENITNLCQCRVDFVLKESFTKDVNIYYGLDNFYQNHRRYLLSRDNKQLSGDTDASLSRCYPFNEDQGKKIAPCGAIANSMFNDSFTLKISPSETIQINRRDIAWESDKQIKFKNPPGSLNPTEKDFAYRNFTKPPAWSRPVWELDINDNENNGFLNEDFLVWMRTAAFPSFRKLYGRIDHNVSDFQNGFPNGSYYFIVNYNYPVHNIDGRKFIVLSNTSFLGGKNNFIGIAYIVTGVLSIVIGAFLLVVHVRLKMEEKDLKIDRYTAW
ncbi:unnamed protein product [Meganyctiphanes norvegica]|uniref:Cell cycle control protein 50A n=1 Tax=Meganyctiphanes norvegica TaxID=48144 RepID=A0AAV2QR68_MEGNR